MPMAQRAGIALLAGRVGLDVAGDVLPVPRGEQLERVAQHVAVAVDHDEERPIAADQGRDVSKLHVHDFELRLDLEDVAQGWRYLLSVAVLPLVGAIPAARLAFENGDDLAS